MAISSAVLQEFDLEMAGTRKVLERVPEEKFGWTPHQKSKTLGALASHVAGLPSFVPRIFDLDSFDVNPPGAPPRQAPAAPKSRQELLDTFDKNVAQARAAISNASDEKFAQPWSLVFGGKTVATAPRIAMLRRMALSHLIHHRAQLGVYLRLNDVPVPALYGPSADEQPF